MLLSRDTVDPDGIAVGALPVTPAMSNFWQNLISTKRARIKEIAQGWV